MTPIVPTDDVKDAQFDGVIVVTDKLNRLLEGTECLVKAIENHQKASTCGPPPCVFIHRPGPVCLSPCLALFPSPPWTPHMHIDIWLVSVQHSFLMGLHVKNLPLWLFDICMHHLLVV